MNSVGIIGFGRFGKVLANILQKGFAIKAYDPKPIGEFPGVEFTDLESLLKEKINNQFSWHYTQDSKYNF